MKNKGRKKGNIKKKEVNVNNKIRGMHAQWVGPSNVSSSAKNSRYAFFPIGDFLRIKKQRRLKVKRQKKIVQLLTMYTISLFAQFACLVRTSH